MMETPYSCSICHQAFSQLISLGNHVETIHMPKGPVDVHDGPEEIQKNPQTALTDPDEAHINSEEIQNNPEEIHVDPDEIQNDLQTIQGNTKEVEIYPGEIQDDPQGDIIEKETLENYDSGDDIQSQADGEEDIPQHTVNHNIG